MDNVSSGLLGFLLGCIMMLVVFLAWPPQRAVHEIHQQAIDANVARYHPQTGEFEFVPCEDK
jgi:hypothetical protein